MPAENMVERENRLRGERHEEVCSLLRDIVKAVTPKNPGPSKAPKKAPAKK